MGDFKRLIAWQRAHALALDLHRTLGTSGSRSFTGLRRQMLRAAGSIPDNLAEGCAKRTRAELARYAETSYGSVKELQNQMLRARALDIIGETDHDRLQSLADEAARLCFAIARGRKDPSG
jgi:four helix bundle protein